MSYIASIIVLKMESRNCEYKLLYFPDTCYTKNDAEIRLETIPRSLTVSLK